MFRGAKSSSSLNQDVELFDLLNEFCRVHGLQQHVDDEYTVPDDIWSYTNNVILIILFILCDVMFTLQKRYFV